MATAADPKQFPIDGKMPAEVMVEAAAMVREGRSYSLAATRFPGMPLFPGHPQFMVLSYRTPQGLKVGKENLWAPMPNDACLGCMTELVQSTSHSGAHIDALAHMTIGDDATWYGGARADEHLGDFGPIHGDGAKLPPIFGRGVLLDAAGHKGVQCLAKGEPITADDVLAMEESQGVRIRPWDTVLIRTGYMSHWPDAEAMAAHKTPGPDLTVAHLLVERGVIATGTDTETYEVQPTNHPGEPVNPQPVHTLLLIEHGIYIMESLDLEELARDQVYEFLFVALPTKIQGATGSMLDPLAMV